MGSCIQMQTPGSCKTGPYFSVNWLHFLFSAVSLYHANQMISLMLYSEAAHRLSTFSSTSPESTLVRASAISWSASLVYRAPPGHYCGAGISSLRTAVSLAFQNGRILLESRCPGLHCLPLALDVL